MTFVKHVIINYRSEYCLINLLKCIRHTFFFYIDEFLTIYMLDINRYDIKITS